jgi:quinol monooxygenase YgiN
MSATAVGVVRVACFHARPGQTAQLLAAAGDNARAARAAAGCHSAEVCTAPEASDTVLVISRWQTAAALEAFLAWHQQQAHDSVLPHATGRPQTRCYTVVPVGGSDQ